MEQITCPSCGAENPVEAAVCESCGEDLSTVRSVIDTANKHYNEALALAHAGKLDEAIGQLEAALALNAENPQFHNLMGTMYARKGLYSEAIRAWERCLMLDPEMEKAHKNIEKAQDMEAEAAEEQERRPFLLATIGAGVAAALFLMTTLYFGTKSFFQSGDIRASNKQIEDKNESINSISSQLAQWKSKYEAINSKFPEGGLNEILGKIDQLETIAEERKKEIDNLHEQRRNEIHGLKQRISEMNQEKQVLSNEAQKSKTLQSLLNQTQKKVSDLQATIEEKDIQIKEERQRVNDLREKLKLAQETSKSIKEDKEVALANLKKSHQNEIDRLESEKRSLLQEIADLERTIQDIRYANELVVEAEQNLENNQFQLANQNVTNALKRAPQHSTAQYFQEKVQRILNDPVQMEILRQEAKAREQERLEKSLEIANQNLDTARDYIRQGKFDEAIELAQRTRNLAQAVNKPELVQESKELESEAEDEKQQLHFIYLEAKKDIEQGNVQAAKRHLEKILKRSPEHEEAQKMLHQIASAS